MASAKGLFGAVVGRFLFREAAVTDVRDVAEGFRLVACEGLGDHEPGDKIQVYLGGEGMRTYTPVASSSLLLYVHGSASPGARWASGLAAGERFQFFGPRRSIRPDDEGPLVLFGDETSFAVAKALGTGRQVASVFEVNHLAAAKTALSEIGVEGEAIQRRPGHLDEIATRLADALARTSGATLVMTGSAQSIQALRSRPQLRRGKVKAYWAVGKRGLD